MFSNYKLVNYILLTIVCFPRIFEGQYTSKRNSDRKRLLPWSAEDYPSPWSEPVKCGRMLPSTICDPDRLLSSEQVQLIDKILWDHGRKATCLCSSCGLAKQGTPIGIALMEDVSFNFPQSTADKSVTPSPSQWQQFADDLRKKWHFGDCDNDALILLSPYGGAISLGDFTRKLLKDSHILRLEADLSPKTPEEQQKFIIAIISEIHSLGRNQSKYLSDLISSRRPSITASEELDPSGSNRNTIKLGAKTGSPLSSPPKPPVPTPSQSSLPPSQPLLPSPQSPPKQVIDIDKDNQLRVGSSLPLPSATGNTMKSNTFIAAAENDEFPVPEDRKVNTSLAFIIIGSLTVLLVSLVALFLIIWYYRTKTGNIEPSALYNKPQPVEKAPADIKAVKYEPCKTEEPGLPV